MGSEMKNTSINRDGFAIEQEALFQDAQTAEENGDRSRAIRLYRSIIENIQKSQPVWMLADWIQLDERYKDVLVDCQLGLMRCELQLLHPPETIARSPSGSRARSIIHRYGSEIQKYHLTNRKLLWSKLRSCYLGLEKTYRQKGWREVARELQKARYEAEYNEIRSEMVKPGPKIRNWLTGQLKLLKTGFTSFISRFIIDYSRGVFLLLGAVILVLVMFAGIYYTWGCVGTSSDGPRSTNFIYYIAYSVFVFTGSEPGPVTSCDRGLLMTATMPVEAILAYLFTVFGVAMLINIWSSERAAPNEENGNSGSQ